MSAGHRKQLANWLSTRDPACLDLGRVATLLYLVAGCALIVGWHTAFERDAARLDHSFKARPGGVGVLIDAIKPLFYFYHYTGHFPISFLGAKDALVDDPRIARALIEPREIPRPLLVGGVNTMLRKGDFGSSSCSIPTIGKMAALPGPLPSLSIAGSLSPRRSHSLCR